MRTLEQLYTILYTEYLKGFTPFICIHIHGLRASKLITDEEFMELLCNFNSNRPTPQLHTLFYNHEMFSRTSWNWFGNGDYARKVRSEFLNYLIKNHRE